MSVCCWPLSSVLAVRDAWETDWSTALRAAFSAEA
jgi:hypothetical protein